MLELKHRPGVDQPRQKEVVLFLCSGNSARSQMAEALLRRYAGERYDVHSAGLDPSRGVHPMTVRVLRERGFDTAGLRAKNVSEYLGKVGVAHAIFVCERAQKNCPRILPFALYSLYWPFDDPAAAGGTEDERLMKFNEVFDQIDRTIRQWLDEKVGTTWSHQ